MAYRVCRVQGLRASGFLRAQTSRSAVRDATCRSLLDFRKSSQTSSSEKLFPFVVSCSRVHPVVLLVQRVPVSLQCLVLIDASSMYHSYRDCRTRFTRLVSQSPKPQNLRTDTISLLKAKSFAPSMLLWQRFRVSGVRVYRDLRS